MQRRTISLGLVAVAALPLWGCAAAGIANGPGGAAHGKTARQWSDALAGIAEDEIADPRPFCEILRQWSTLHPEFAFRPRKFKISINGAREDRAALGWYDVGL